ncbi:uncharacterized protein LOC124896562 [Capsicum annuum]|uniref:uncharacterized protein LOC124896562 n=1 Tax=Capsicum annuum TaxID=4072 RepID=UPI001FB126CF|nr:uncharacterized protein LOC124896562 [Capsicum annuum]
MSGSNVTKISVYMQQVEEKKKKITESREKERQEKRAKTADQIHFDRRSQSFQTNHVYRARIPSHREVWHSSIVLFGDMRLAVSIIREGVSYMHLCVILVVRRVIFRGTALRLQGVLQVPSLRQTLLHPPPQKGTISVAGSSYNQLYALTNIQEAEASLGVVTDTLQTFSRDVYVLLDLRFTLSYVIPYVVIGFGFEPDVIAEPFSIGGDSVMAKRVYKNCVVSICS